MGIARFPGWELSRMLGDVPPLITPPLLMQGGHRAPPPHALLQVASLPTKHRLLQSLVASLERQGGSRLEVVTARRGVLQAVCSAVDNHKGERVEHHCLASIMDAWVTL
jgi:hypothetical protein